MKQYTNEEIANDWNLWTEYVDPDGITTEKEFNAMDLVDRMKIVDSIE